MLDIPFVAQMPASRHRAGSTGLQINNCRHSVGWLFLRLASLLDMTVMVALHFRDALITFTFQAVTGYSVYSRR